MDQHTLQARIAKSFASNITFLIASLVFQFIGFVMLSNQLVFVVEACIVLVLLVIALVLYGCMRYGSCAQTGNLKVFVYCTFLATFISGFLALTVIGRFGNAIGPSTGSGDSVLYPLILMGFGGLIALLLSLGILCGLKPCNTASLTPPSNEMSTQPVVGINSVQPQSGYLNEGQPSDAYAGQPNPGHNNEAQPSVSYAGHSLPENMYHGQQSISYIGQPNPGYNGDGQHSVTYTSQQQPEYLYQGQPQAACAVQPNSRYNNKDQSSISWPRQSYPLNMGQSSVSYAGQQQPGYMNEDQSSASYA